MKNLTWKSFQSTFIALIVCLFTAPYLDAQTWGGSATTTGATSRDGAVGIGPGTANPLGILDVNGSTTLRGDVEIMGDRYFINNGNVGTGYIRFLGGSSNPNPRLVIDGGSNGLKIESNVTFDNSTFLRNDDDEDIFWFRKQDLDGFDSPLHLLKSVHVNNPLGEEAFFSQNSLGIRLDSDGNGAAGMFSIDAGLRNSGTDVELFRVQQNGRVGISATSPLAQLHLNYEDNIPGMLMERNMVGTKWEDTKALIGISSNSAQSGLRFEISDDDGSSYQDILFLSDTGYVGIGTTAPAHKLDVCGTIRCKSIKVKAGWCDYVFENDYQLRPLEEVEAFIDANHHLPNIPPASTVEGEGLDLGDMQTRMMEKIEELTLYTIDLNKQVKELQAQLDAVESK